MAAIYSREWLDRVRALLDGVQSVGQAQAAVAATVKMALAARDAISQWLFETNWRKQAKADIDSKLENLQRQDGQLTSSDLGAMVGTVWSGQLRQTCLDLWLYCELVKGQFPEDETSAAERYGFALQGSAEDLSASVREAPSVVVRAGVGAVRSVVDPLLEETGDLGKKIGDELKRLLDNLLGPMKWYLIGGVVVVVAGGVAYVYAKRKGIL